MSKIELHSREWCELIFEGRNQLYGAYVLRREASKRYRRVGYFMVGFLLLLLLSGGIVGYFVYQRVQQEVADIEKELRELLDQQEPKKDFKTQRLSRGRRAAQGKSPTASETAPLVTDRVRQSIAFGIQGPDDSKITFDDNFEDLDLQHNNEQTDLSVEGAQLVQTEEVEEMPQFPGGIPAFRIYLDKEIHYSLSARRREVQGEIQASFIILEDGSVSEIKIEQSLDLSLDRSVQNALQRMPKWKPGKKGGKACPVKISIPVVFTL